MKAVQFFSPEYLENSKKFSTEEIVQFLETFRSFQEQGTSKSKLISLKVDEKLLKAFKAQCLFSGVKYQTQIKELMKKFVSD